MQTLMNATPDVYGSAPLRLLFTRYRGVLYGALLLASIALALAGARFAPPRPAPAGARAAAAPAAPAQDDDRPLLLPDR